MMFLVGVDLYFCAYSYVLYQFLQKLVTKLEYDSEEDKVLVH